MSFKKKLLAIVAVGGLTAATAVPAMALENEFHGMFRTFGYMSNAYAGGGTLFLGKDAKTNSYAEQRARLMYIAKASDDLKLVTHFELDSRWGGQSTETAAAAANKYPIGDAGGLDADRVTLETKNVYLDFNLGSANVKLGLQPYSDAYKGIFGLWDGSGAVVSSKMGAFTPTLAWFRFTDNNSAPVGKQTLDMTMVDGKFAISKDVTVGASYYLVQNDQGANSAISKASVDFEKLNVFGVNAAAKAGPAALEGFFLYETGDQSATQDIGAFAGGAIAKVKAGPGNINASFLYLSGESTPATGKRSDFKSLTKNGAVSYFNQANMWLLVRQGATINTSTAIGTTDLTKGGRGFLGGFAGYEGAAGKVLYSANAGYAKANKKQGTDSSSEIGTEVNATIGYKVADNLTLSLTGAYAFLGDAMKGKSGISGSTTDADNPYMTNLQVNYTF